MVERSIRKLICYGLEKRLFDPRDEVFVTNRLLEILHLDGISCEDVFSDVDLEETLRELLDYAVSAGLIEDNVTVRDLFDTKLMGALLPPPSAIIDRFGEEYAKSPEAATEYYYKLSGDSDYIRRYRIKKDMKWTVETDYGTMDITINLSKPEKDPRLIALAKATASGEYPKCQLCRECEGYAGRLNFPARQNHRVIPITLNGEDWCFQYSPYVYYNEHCIVFNAKHTPMIINHSTFVKLFDFIKMFPHYTIGSNAGLPVVGGSILSHEHYQGGRYTFAMAKAPIERPLTFAGFEDVEAGIVRWPMSVIRLRADDAERVIALADVILAAWRRFTDASVGVYAETDGEAHNTVTPIARMNGDRYELDLVLRNNLTTEEYPLGVFHPHPELHHIKKENIGLIEVMGLAVLPTRLKQEMSLLAATMLNGADIRADETIAKHADWADEIRRKHPDLGADNIDEILRQEIGLVFTTVLEHAGVFKRDEQGQAAFLRFIDTIR